MTNRHNYGTKWWGKRFLETLEQFGWLERVQRGRSYAGQGRVLDLVTSPGRAEARVQGSRPKPYQVRIEFVPLRPVEWDRATDALASRPDLVAGLLSGEISADLKDALVAVGTHLFPDGPEDLDTSCSCPDWATPCKHVAAVYYTLAESLEADPLLLVELRGRSRELLLRDLTERWKAEGHIPSPDTAEHPTSIASTPFDAFWTPGPDAAALEFRFEPVPVPGALLGRLKLPSEFASERDVLSRLKSYYETVHLRAQELVHASRSGTSLHNEKT